MPSKFRIKSIYSERMGSNIRHWGASPHPKPAYLLEISIGEAHQKKSETFKVFIATPEALREMADPGHIVVRDRSTIVITEYDFVAIDMHLTKIVETCNRPE